MKVGTEYGDNTNGSYSRIGAGMGDKKHRDTEPENSGEAYQRDLDQLYGTPEDSNEDNEEENTRNEPCDG